MIVKIKILDINNKELVMMFGDSYKSWFLQMKEFFWQRQKWLDGVVYPAYKAVDVETSESEWIGWGGLKWCQEKHFQSELNREGCQQNDPDNPNPRKYADMNFRENTYAKSKIKRWYKIQYQNRELVEEKVFN